MNKVFLSILIISVLTIFACKKSKTKKQIAGQWKVTAMFSDEQDFLLLKRKGQYLPAGCDTIYFEREEKLNMEVLFKDNGGYIRTQQTVIKYIDTAATRAQCSAVYADSTLNSTEEGTWRFEGKETLELIANNNNYEGNKLISISSSEMEWQTDLTVNQGFVVFNGIKTTKFIKL